MTSDKSDAGIDQSEGHQANRDLTDAELADLSGGWLGGITNYFINGLRPYAGMYGGLAGGFVKGVTTIGSGGTNTLSDHVPPPGQSS